jgi:isocitrate/isopropylmalate dehydrogenase
LLSGAMLLDHYGFGEQARALEAAITRVYNTGTTLTIDQGGTASTAEFVEAVRGELSRSI